MIVQLFPSRTLPEIGRRVVKRWPREIVLTDGTKLELWREVSAGTRGAVLVAGLAYVYARDLRARELWFQSS